MIQHEIASEPRALCGDFHAPVCEEQGTSLRATEDFLNLVLVGIGVKGKDDSGSAGLWPQLEYGASSAHPRWERLYNYRRRI